MTQRRCPLCGKTIKLENARRHFRNVHPGKDPTLMLSQEEDVEIRQTQRGGPVVSRSVILALEVLAVAAVVIVAAVLALPVLFPGGTSASGVPTVVTYCGGEGTTQHYHPLLVINVNGVQKHLPYDASQPGDIGYINQPGFTNPAYYCPTNPLTGPEIHDLHTHDGSGIIHVELPPSVTSTPTLGNFFTIWGEPLTPTVVWLYTGQVKATMLNSDTGRVTDFSSNPGSIPLYPPAAGATTSPYPIPQSLIFYGAYGNGQSGGQYSGEIIWLNVTTG